MPTGVFPRTEAWRKNLSDYWTGRKRIGVKRREGYKISDETRAKLSKAGMGRKLSSEIRKKISLSKKGKRTGSDSHSWKGGVHSLSRRVRDSGKYKEWRQGVMLRDSFTCGNCGQIGGDLEVHHVKSFSVLLDEAKKYMPLFTPYIAAMNYSPLWDMPTGITLCHKCHTQTSDYGPKIFKGQPHKIISTPG